MQYSTEYFLIKIKSLKLNVSKVKGFVSVDKLYRRQHKKVFSFEKFFNRRHGYAR